jgi:hypothetical protein
MSGHPRKSRSQKSQPARRHRSQLRLEQLERRELLATLSWDGGGNLWGRIL